MKPGYYWIITFGIIAPSHPFIANFDGSAWWGQMGRITAEIEVISERLEPPVRFEIETVPG